MPLTGNIHYVKFLRGPVAAWNRITKKDDDTLYFIYQDKDADKGVLYLGNKLISGSLDGSVDISLGDIANVDIDGETLAHKQILIYNNNTGQWENADLSDLLDVNVGIMEGATAVSSGREGLVPVPQAGDQLKFLQGSGEWTEVPLHTFSSENFAIENKEVGLLGYRFAPVGASPIKTENGLAWILPQESLKRVQVANLGELQAAVHGQGTFTVDENSVYIVPTGNPDISNFYDEYIIVNNNLEKIGGNSQVADLSNYVTKNVFNLRVGNLEEILNDQFDEEGNVTHEGLITDVNNIKLCQAKIGDLDTLITSSDNVSNTLVEEVNLINERLTWNEA